MHEIAVFKFGIDATLFDLKFNLLRAHADIDFMGNQKPFANIPVVGKGTCVGTFLTIRAFGASHRLHFEPCTKVVEMTFGIPIQVRPIQSCADLFVENGCSSQLQFAVGLS